MNYIIELFVTSKESCSFFTIGKFSKPFIYLIDRITIFVRYLLYFIEINKHNFIITVQL